MTDRHAAYIVVMDHDVREDDARKIIDAILMIRCVLDVKPVTASYEVAVAESRVRHEMREKLLDVVFPK